MIDFLNCVLYLKVIAAPASQASSSTIRSDTSTTQTKTTKKTATEPKKSISETETTAIEQTKTPGAKEIKKYEVETSKGILSITTTIEDSKINDIVFEKTKSGSKKTQTSTVVKSSKKSTQTIKPPTTEEIVSEVAKETNKITGSKLDAAISDMVKQAVKKDVGSKMIVMDVVTGKPAAKVTTVGPGVAAPLPDIKTAPVIIKIC